MISPVGEAAILARDNKNGFLSSILGWIRAPEDIVSERNFTGFRIYPLDSAALENLPTACKVSLTQTIECDDLIRDFWTSSYHAGYGNTIVTDSVCDAGCGVSLKQWFNRVLQFCDGYC
jgi:hypothetical protein